MPLEHASTCAPPNVLENACSKAGVCRPWVISGSHNLSKAASDGNDENFLILRGDTDAADCYGCELMRIYDHYRFRWYVKTHKTDESRGLFTTDKWTDPYYGHANTLKFRDRVRFAGD